MTKTANPYPVSDEVFQQAVAVIETMLQSVVNRNKSGVLGCFSKEADAYVYPEGPRWLTKGGSAIETGWEAYFAGGFGIDKWSWLDGPVVFGDDNYAQVLGVLDYVMAGDGTTSRLRMRMTWLLRHENVGWRIIHEHGSQPLNDPYGAGDWWPEGEALPSAG